MLLLLLQWLNFTFRLCSPLLHQLPLLIFTRRLDAIFAVDFSYPAFVVLRTTNRVSPQFRRGPKRGALALSHSVAYFVRKSQRYGSLCR